MSGLPPQNRGMAKMLLDCRPWLAAALMLVTVSYAKSDDIDHQEARRLVQEGRILPLAEIVARVGRSVPGEVLDIELEREDGAYVYELEILRPNGRLQEVEVDAGSGRILKLEDDD